MPAREAALARGFVLGEDEGVDAATEEDFRRAGLSHLLAVSGQNVTLLGAAGDAAAGGARASRCASGCSGSSALIAALRAAGRRRALDPAGRR